MRKEAKGRNLTVFCQYGLLFFVSDYKVLTEYKTRDRRIIRRNYLTFGHFAHFQFETKRYREWFSLSPAHPYNRESLTEDEKTETRARNMKRKKNVAEYKNLPSTRQDYRLSVKYN